MAKARNQVIEGKYKGQYIIKDYTGAIHIACGFFNNIKIDATTVNKIELLNAEQSKDIGSSVARGIVGGILLGPAGLIAGALVGKTGDINRFQVFFQNGDKSLIEVDKKLSEPLFALQWQIENK